MRLDCFHTHSQGKCNFLGAVAFGDELEGLALARCELIERRGLAAAGLTAKLATAWDAGAPDENTAYYVGKLRELAEKFLPFVERDGLVEVVPEEEPPPAPVQLTLDLGV